MDTELHVESTVEETLQKVKDGNATRFHVEAQNEEILQRAKVEDAIRELTVMH